MALSTVQSAHGVHADGSVCGSRFLPRLHPGALSVDPSMDATAEDAIGPVAVVPGRCFGDPRDDGRDRVVRRARGRMRGRAKLHACSRAEVQFPGADQQLPDPQLRHAKCLHPIAFRIDVQVHPFVL